MTWRMSVVHRTTYEYESSVVASFNELRMTPVSNAHQLLVHHRTTISPSVALFTYRDYWGTTVEAFDLHTPHEILDVISDNTVETSASALDPAVDSWSLLAQPRQRDLFFEYLTHTDLTPRLPGSDEIVTAIKEQPTPLAAIRVCADIVASHMTYTSGSTSVFTPADAAWEARRGVCQDYSHAALSLLRSAGVPARYVSGYHYSGSGDIGDAVVGESHAWLEAWAGQWVPIDPTNGREVGERHVVVAYGRDYHDVSPMRGIFSGGLGRSIDVVVTMVRLAR
jgi:transglutaminase-like putative cysteine protease